MGALNKLNDRNMDSISETVVGLVKDGKVDGGDAARALLLKSSDDSTFADVYCTMSCRASISPVPGSTWWCRPTGRSRWSRCLRAIRATSAICRCSPA